MPQSVPECGVGAGIGARWMCGNDADRIKTGNFRMDEKMFQRKLSELVAEIGTLPTQERKKLEVLAEQTRRRHKELKDTVNGLQESIDFLRLSIKYLLFDLEATRRENEYLRKMLESDGQEKES